MCDDERLTELRYAARRAQGELLDAIFEFCPDHNPLQHRDRKPAWCPKCGRDNLGRYHAEPTPSRGDETTPGVGRGGEG